MFSQGFKNNQTITFEYYGYKPYETEFSFNILDNPDLDKNRLSIGKIKNNKGSYYSVTSEDFEGSELRVYFDNSLKVLKGWDIIENEKISIKLNILEIRKLENLNNFDKNIFKFSESMRANLRGFLGPYKRKLKRLPTSNTN